MPRAAEKIRPVASAKEASFNWDHGSDPGSMVTRAEKVAGGFKLHDVHALILGRAQTGIQAFF